MRWSRVRRRDVLTGTALGTVTFAVYMLGSGRNYDYDSSETVGTFVATRSLLDPFRRQDVFNNHPLLSFVDHLVYSAGLHGPTALRVLPVLFAAGAVALVAGWATRCWGALAGTCAGAMLAANPLFAFSSRGVRGYSLVTLSAVASTLLLVCLLRREGRPASAGYVIAAAAGVATHLYALLPLAAQAAALLVRGAFDRRWGGRLGAAIGLGGLAYVGIGARMVESAQREGEQFRPRFPLTLARTLLGGTAVAVVACAVLLVLGSAALRRREAVAAAVTIAAGIAATWLLLRPADLYPRFFVWLVPALAFSAAAAVARWPAAAAVACVAVAALVAADARQWTQNPLPDRQAAQLVADARTRGDRPCVLPWVRGSLLAYTSAPHEVTRPRRLVRCDVVVGNPADARSLRRAAQRDLPYEWVLRATTPFLVFSRVPRSTLFARRLPPYLRSRPSRSSPTHAGGRL